MEHGDPDLPLRGIHVLDLSRVVAAPLATMLLGDLGAQVIKVERPGAGDDTRSWGPPFRAGESAYYLSLNRNKRGIAVDFGQPAGRRILDALVTEWADVVVENFRGESLTRLGLDPERTLADHPHLVWAAVRGYPGADPRPGYDFIIQAASGFMALNGPADAGPTRAPVAVSDLVTGLHLAVGILAALVRQARTGRGGHVETSLYESQIASLPNLTAAHLMTGRPPARMGNAHPQLAPYELFLAADGPLAVGVGNDHEFAALAGVLGRTDLAHDPRFATNAERVANRESLVEMLNQAFIEGTVAEWVERLNRAGVPAGPVRTLPEALLAQETRDAGLVQSLAHPRAGPLALVGNPLRWNQMRPPAALPPPLRGQHTVEVLREIGYDESAVAALLASGAVEQADSSVVEGGGR